MALSVAMFLVMLAVGALVYAPMLRRQRRLAEEGGPDSEDYRAADQRSNIVGITLILVVIYLIYLMVFRPALWG